MFADMTFNRWKEYKPNNVDKREANERVRATICSTRNSADEAGLP